MEITRAKSAVGVTDMSWANPNAWFPIIREPFAGAWQRNLEIRRETVLSNPTDFACRTLIASDIAKLRLKLVEQIGNIWSETANPAYSPVLRAPNRFQNRIQFWENWILSKLGTGNTYVLKGRDDRNVVTSLYVLDPFKARPLVAPDGEIYYSLAADNIAGILEQVVVPASEIIHDRFNCLFHPLCGLPPLFASGLSATQGQRIRENSLKFFTNNSQPGGILSAAGAIDDTTADRIKKHWEQNFQGDNVGKVAVLGDGLKYEAMSVNALNSQLIEQLKQTDENICTAYHVPKYKVGIGDPPAFNNIQALNVEYYSQAVQRHIEDAEECLDNGLRLPSNLGLEFDIENLLRMDSTTQMTVLKEAVSAAIMAPNEARAKIGLKPVPGGDAPLAQQQDFSLAALAKRDAKDDPFVSSKPPAAPASSDGFTSSEDETLDDAAKAQMMSWEFDKAWQHLPPIAA